MRHIVKWSALLALALMLSMAAFAQPGGALQGKITDEAGQPVIGAMIQVTGATLQGFQGAATDTDGPVHHSLPARRPGLPGEGRGPRVQQRHPEGHRHPPGHDHQPALHAEPGQDRDRGHRRGPPHRLEEDRGRRQHLRQDDQRPSPWAATPPTSPILAPSAVDIGDLGRARPAISGASGPENSYTVNGVETSPVRRRPEPTSPELRLHRGDRGQDGRYRRRVRRPHGRQHQLHHQERRQRVPRRPVRLLLR